MLSNTVYIIGAVAVIALLVIVLVLRARKRRALAPTEPASVEAAPGWASGPDTWPADDEPPTTAAGPVDDNQPPATAAEPHGHAASVRYPGSVGYTGPADDAESTITAQPNVVAEPADEASGVATPTEALPVAGSEPLMPATAAARPPAVAMSEMDPAFVMVRSLMQNSGELNPAEFRRLELYRPERVVDAVDTLMPKMTGRANESRRTRLQRIRQYAVSLMAQSEGKGIELAAEGGTTLGAAPAEPAMIGPLSPSEAASVVPPEDWGLPSDGSELTLDPELSVLHDDPIVAPEVENGAPEVVDMAPAVVGMAPAVVGMAPAVVGMAPEVVDVAPESERSDDDLASMSPQELGRTLGLSNDIDHKKAAIDALERLGTPEALSQLHQALEDPDPDVQIHALSAAERLLGPSS